MPPFPQREGQESGVGAGFTPALLLLYDLLGWQSNGSRLDYQLDGDAPLTETNSTTAQVNLYGNGLVMSGGETLLPDGLGATRQTTNSSQSVVWTGTSQAFGVPLASSGSTVNHYQFGAAGGYRSDGFGPTYASPLLKVGARYYDPEFGCFPSRDTDLTQSPYGYCYGDPVNFSDPSGHGGVDWDKPWQTITHAVGSGDGDAANSSGSTSTGSSGPSTPDGNGGQITVNNGTIIDTNGNESISLSGLGGPSATLTDTVYYPLAPGITAIGIESYTPGTGAGSQSLGINATFGSGTLQVKIVSDGSYSAFGGLDFKF